MTGYFSTLPNVCYCTTWGKLNQQKCPGCFFPDTVYMPMDPPDSS